MANHRIWSARTDVTTLLATELGDDAVVTGFPRTPENPSTRRVYVGVQRVEPPNVACPVYVTTLDVFAVSPLTEPGAGDDAADDLADAVLTVLDDHGIVWTSCDRAVWNGTHPAYQISVEMRNA